MLKIKVATQHNNWLFLRETNITPIRGTNCVSQNNATTFSLNKFINTSNFSAKM